jgi:hypothetical protein
MKMGTHSEFCKDSGCVPEIPLLIYAAVLLSAGPLFDGGLRISIAVMMTPMSEILSSPIRTHQ